MNQLYSFRFKTGYTIQQKMMMDWYWDARELVRVRTIFLENAKKNLRFFMAIYNRWEKDHAKNIAWYTKAEKINLSSLNDRQLYELYESIYHANVRQGAHGYLADCFLSSGEEDWLSAFIKKRVGTRKDADDIIRILTLPIFLTYSNEQAASLAAINKKIQGKWKQFDYFYKYIRKNKIIWNALLRHQKKFYWAENNYFSHTLLVKDFARKLFALLSEKTEDHKKAIAPNRTKKQVLLKKLNDPSLTNVITMSEYMTHMQDYRKMALVRFSHFFDAIIKEMAKRIDVEHTSFYHLVEPEMKSFFLEKKIDQKKIELRCQKNFAYGSPDGFVVYEGKDYEKYVNESYFLECHENISSFRGVSACHGVVKGVVRIVRNAKTDTLNSGEILVTNNTTPEFVPLMKKAAAIITEQGGITTHAAIISRELGIPCIIGTKIATKVLKDGDVIEVDANNGAIRKISSRKA